jgi:alkaline phosphatase D
MDRRTFLTLTGSAALCAPALIGCATSGPNWSSDPFALGVAAGDPASDGFVLWTRLAPDPVAADAKRPGGLGGGNIEIAYEIATDPNMREIVRRGTAIAEAAHAHSVHLEIHGLAPGRPYWYRFTSGPAQSRIGKAATLPALGARVDNLRFAFVSCANYEQGYFSAYRHLADEQPDLVLFLGDYIYEYIERRRPTVRLHSDGVEATNLATYRNRYAQYRLDPDLQRLHATAPMLITWDDHEVDNDYTAEWSSTFADPVKFAGRRRAAYQAFYEHMPLRPLRYDARTHAIRLHDRFAYGDLLEISLTDPRQYRSRLACPTPPDRGRGHLETLASCPELIDPSRSFLGLQQEGWLTDGLAHSRARWNVIAQSTLMSQWRQRGQNNEINFWTEDWNGYAPSRTRLLQYIHDARVANPVVIGGDIHSFWANDLKLDFNDMKSPTVATELIGSSITSVGPNYETFVKYLPDNPHVRFFESRRRGYVSVDLTRERMTTNFRAVSDVRAADASVATLKSFTVEDGKTGVVS